MRRILLALLIVTIILATIGFGTALAKGGGGTNNHHSCNNGTALIVACVDKNHHIIQVPGGINVVACVLSVGRRCA